MPAVRRPVSGRGTARTAKGGEPRGAARTGACRFFGGTGLRLKGAHLPRMGALRDTPAGERVEFVRRPSSPGPRDFDQAGSYRQQEAGGFVATACQQKPNSG
jgi:hypothetical protein